MKKTTLPACLAFFFPFLSVLNAQDISFTSSEENDAAHPCITEQEYRIIEKRCADNIRLMQPDRIERRMTSVALGWPLRPSANETDCSYYRIAAYVDQDTTSGTYRDYNCGTLTYDGHRGTDISTWPFNFYKMDNNLVEVIAAAAGTIIDKHDGEFDRNCSSNNFPANYVIIQHADGSRALYWHMKKNFVTTVAIGQPVAAGDYLGVVGASGSASGPHLHFEVWAGSTSATRIDPYAGACNTLNVSSWWSSQKPYRETSVIRASAHTTDIVLPGCPTTETLNEGGTFQIPFQGVGLPPGYAKFYIFIREELNGLTADISILNPSGTPYLSWTYTSTSDNRTRIMGWSKLLPTVSGTYTFQAIYNGITCSSTFNIINPAGVEELNSLQGMSIQPNPTHNSFTLSLNESLSTVNCQLSIYDVMGREVLRQGFDPSTSSGSGSRSSSVTEPVEVTVNFQLSAGIYLVKVSAGKKVYTQKLVVE